MTNLIFACLLLLVCLCQNGLADDFYIDAKNGNDSYSGSADMPFKTIAKAVQAANELTGTGAITLKVLPGIYTLTDKVAINPIRILDDTTRFTIEAFIMPDDTTWAPAKMPVIQSVSGNNSNTQFPHATGFLVSSSHVTIRGMKFIGNPNPEVPYYYPITREDPALASLEVSQCYFIAENNGVPIQGGIWAHGRNVDINHCVFYACRNAVLLFRAIQGSSMRNCIVYGASESAIWMGDEDPNFEFQNNVISHCDFFWTKVESNKAKYTFTNSVIAGNAHHVGFWNGNIGAIDEIDDVRYIEKNVKRSGKVALVDNKAAVLAPDYLHLTPESVGHNLMAGIFRERRE